MSALFQKLEKEFCPPLDSSLLAALLAEVESDGNARPLSPEAPQVSVLRDTLRELAAHADAAQLSEFADLNLTSHSEDDVSSQDLGFTGFTGTTADTSVSSRSSGSSERSFSTPLGFLQASLPDVPTNRLKRALQGAEKSGRELDMWDVVANILSEESIRELEERGLDALSDDDGAFKEEDLEWEIVLPKSKRSPRLPHPTKRKRAQTTKITLVDIRQQNHGTKQQQKSSSELKSPLPDLWTQVQSIATNIATYLRPHPVSLFLSYLHSPKYQSPYQAICAALESICAAAPPSEPDAEATLLFNLLDILFPEYEPLDFEQRSRLVHETELCIRATNGRGEDIIDAVKLLRELNSDASSGKWELGIYHLPPHKPPPSPIIKTGPSGKRKSLIVVSPPSTPRLPPPASPVPPTPQTEHKPDPNQWQSVPVRRIPDNSPRLAQSIPAYARAAGSNYKFKGSGNGCGKGGKGDVEELLGSQNKIGEHRRKQEEYLKQAAKMWQRGDKKMRGGEVAFYYAEKAREFQALAKQEGLENARIMVQSKRSSTGKYDEIDLHGTTVFEAVTIVKEILQDVQCSQSQPFKIITGKGTHSANKIAVLKPAIKNALVEDGWSVGTWDAGLVVRGRSS